MLYIPSGSVKKIESDSEMSTKSIICLMYSPSTLVMMVKCFARWRYLTLVLPQWPHLNWLNDYCTSCKIVDLHTAQARHCSERKKKSNRLNRILIKVVHCKILQRIILNSCSFWLVQFNEIGQPNV